MQQRCWVIVLACLYCGIINRRESFTVGIGYDDSIERAQELARTVLAEHPAILNEPVPGMPVDGLGTATVNLLKPEPSDPPAA